MCPGGINPKVANSNNIVIIGFTFLIVATLEFDNHLVDLNQHSPGVLGTTPISHDVHFIGVDRQAKPTSTEKPLA